MKLFNSDEELVRDSTLIKTNVILSVLIFLTLSPYFIWQNQALIFRVIHLISNSIIVYIVIKYYDFNINNKGFAAFFFFISFYTMFAGTEVRNFSYYPILTVLFITLRPSEQLRIFNYIVTILTFVYIFGVLSYLLRLVGLNKQIGIAFAPNLFKEPYSVFFGHVEENFLNVYRFSGIFDEAGVVGTINGLILTSIGFSKKSLKSIVLLIAGLVSFSLAFYVILFLNLLFYFNFKKILIAILLLFAVFLFFRDRFDQLIASRLAIENGTIAGDNRASDDFDEYFTVFLEKGGKDLYFGKGRLSPDALDEFEAVSSYKMFIVRYGLIGISLIVLFYGAFVFINFNSRRGWFLFLIFLISAYQRPDLLILFNIVFFIGGIEFMRIEENTKKQLGESNLVSE